MQNPVTQTDLAAYAQTLIAGYDTAKAEFAKAIETGGVVYAMRHQTARVATAEYLARIGYTLAAIAAFDADRYATAYPDYIRTLNRTLRHQTRGGMDGEYHIYEAQATATVLDLLDR